MNRYIIIDLNQTINRAQLLEMRRERWRWVGFVLILLIFGGLGYGVYTINEDLGKLITERESRIEDVKRQINELKADAQLDLSKKDIQNLYKREQERILWADKLKALSEITPEDMAITELALYEGHDNARFVISGISHLYSDEKEFTVVEKFMDVLENEPTINRDFKYIRFLSSDRHITRGQEILQFKIEAREREPRRVKTRQEKALEEMEAKEKSEGKTA